MKIDIKWILKIHPEIREDVLRLVEKINEIDNREKYYPNIQSGVIAEILAMVYNDDTNKPKHCVRGDDMIIQYNKRNEE